MPNDNQLCTVLLLVALGFLIHYLCKSKEGFADELQDHTNEEQSQTEMPEVSEEEPIVEPVAKKPVMAPSVPEQVMAQENDLMNAPVSQEVVPDLPPQPEIKVFEFNGNDTYLLGADIDNAFAPPLPGKGALDAVDLNKNNVKNYDAKDFLPKEINDQWFDTDFSQAKFNINDDKLINTDRYVVGVNTVGQSLKNASYDIRGTVPNPKFTVSPWNNSTYEVDYNLKPLC